MSSRRQKLLERVNWYLQSSLKHITELFTGNKSYYRGGRYRQVSLYLELWFAGNSLAVSTNKYWDLKNATLKCSVMDERCNLQYPKLKISNRMYRNAYFLIHRLKFATTFRVSVIILWIYRTFVCIYLEWSPDNKLSAKTKLQNGVA